MDEEPARCVYVFSELIWEDKSLFSQIPLAVFLPYWHIGDEFGMVMDKINDTLGWEESKYTYMIYLYIAMKICDY